MRRSALTSLVALSLVALAACATSVDDDDFAGLTSDTQNAEPDAGSSGAKLPPPTTGNEDPPEEKDAGATADSGSKTPSTPPSQDSGTPPQNSVDCDINDLVKLAVWQLELATQSSPVPCPCGAGKCCYLGATCLSAL
jgi:hypothetical protein